mmetsp:Transcript_14386/g.23534  ORF Transcript_14386/g.23534 Transcript_14386/m.23534 type:complete len:212 (+) Transcript_14386:818-1453(+)
MRLKISRGKAYHSACTYIRCLLHPPQHHHSSRHFHTDLSSQALCSSRTLLAHRDYQHCQYLAYLSAQPHVVRARGHPHLLQRGQSAHGIHLHARQHHLVHRLAGLHSSEAHVPMHTASLHSALIRTSITIRIPAQQHLNTKKMQSQAASNLMAMLVLELAMPALWTIILSSHRCCYEPFVGCLQRLGCHRHRLIRQHCAFWCATLRCSSWR